MENRTWDFWTDVLGNVYRAGDIVAIAIINGKSPQMVIAEVLSINRIRKNGEVITTRRYVEHEEPIWKKRTRRVNQYEPGGYRFLSYTEVEEDYEEKGEYKQVPYCTVTARPLIDARGFHRWGTGEDGVNKPATYQIPENIILIESRS